MKEDKDQIPNEEEENKEQVTCKERTASNDADQVERPLNPVCATNSDNAKAARKNEAKEAGKTLVRDHKDALIADIECEGPCGKKKKRVCVKPRRKDIKARNRVITLRVALLSAAEIEEQELGKCKGNKAWYGVTAIISFNMTGNCRCVKKKKKKKK